ncbi:hypothetical protein SAMN00768000_0299 [Sulfobacillus thermosulfidooxidans DSM 9293]|uniref:Uncharacterized protein n=1 Tax=Sulfobacillus thermosulfidooxidans (strain DSM 9293 / VKM B-1269 / AT-1) TaxID=929705 RepID=A0A1W1W734_SULTA|nr:hypothetical protein SAMN00768000_0299 [Sulfobacillus thermosulfidooxidans DSM 9293]
MTRLPEPQEVLTDRPRGLHPFRPYRKDPVLLPMDFTDMIPLHHGVRVANDAVNHLTDAIFEHVFPGEPPLPSHPKLMANTRIPNVCPPLAQLPKPSASRFPVWG